MHYEERIIDKETRYQVTPNGEWRLLTNKDLTYRITKQREVITQSLRGLTPDFTDPENLETKTLSELIELLIAAGKYWKEQAES